MTIATPSVHIYKVGGVPVPQFLDWGYRTPRFRTQVKNLLSNAVNMGDLWRLNYTKTVFGTPLGELMTLPTSIHSWIRMGYPSPFPRSSPELVPHFLAQSYAPGSVHVSANVRLNLKSREEHLIAIIMPHTRRGGDIINCPRLSVRPSVRLWRAWT